MTDWRREYRDELVTQREDLVPKTSLKGPILGAALTVMGIGVAAAGVSVTAPAISIIGLVAALGGAPLSINAFVERSDNLERLRKL